MEVAVRLSDPLLATIRVVLGDDHDLLPIASWMALERTLQERSVDVVVLEPFPLREEELRALVELVARHPATPVVVYTLVNPPAMRATVELARVGARLVVFKGFDDSPRRFRALLEELGDTAWSSALWQWVAERLAHTPARVERAVERLFRYPHRYVDVTDLVRASGLTRRTLERWLTRAGIGSAKMLVLSARVERAHYLLRHSAAPVGDIAARLGFPTSRLFARQVRLATGHPPSALRHALTAAELHAALAARLALPPATAARGDVA
jgi:transcriptional regulator GlxA family with amidase domain